MLEEALLLFFMMFGKILRNDSFRYTVVLSIQQFQITVDFYITFQ